MPEIDADQLSIVISHALAPSFLLTAIAALISILIARMTRVTDRLRKLNLIADDDAARAWLKADIARLKRRERLLNHSLHLVVTSGIAITALLLFGFVVSLLGYRHEPGAGVLFVVALALLTGALLRFLQEIRIALSEPDHHD
ncbi:DUF2721 domain-containing protein [Arvimicrobium flavum]|uniref:DUF2721 domain-containing protein n=1 Tax=Arvimicrobium flavum TaxID=3393320 RepID=UPI00237BE137|nr:DUF2721 domain-containing protein [Mesorhizobium shangrilense]